MGQGRAQIYNLISIFFLVLTLIAILLVTTRMAAPAPVPTPVVMALPTAAVLPSPTPTFTSTYTPIPTFTETLTPTITPSITPSLTWTLIPSLTPSLTFTVAPTEIIPPTDTPRPEDTLAPSATITASLTITSTLAVTATQTPSVTPTLNSFTPQPTEPPPSPYPFVLRDGQVIYTLNFANTAGCSWQGIGGQIFDLNGQPLLQMRVHVFGAGGVDFYVASGSNTLYGFSGWEVPLNSSLTGNSYIVELQSPQGTIISPQVTVTFEADNCTRNLALVNFEQTRPF